MSLSVAPVTPDRWNDLVDLFERRGPRGGRSVADGCWCMYWRLDRKQLWAGWRGTDGHASGNRQALEGIVNGREPPGLLAYDDTEPVGWLALAPRDAYPRLDRHRALPRVDDRPVWSISCFYINWASKGRGVGEALVRGACEYTRERGIQILEAYPSRPDDNDPFTGYEPMFAANGFEKVFDEGGRRSIWRWMAQ
jgi:GNAT superfamily N-acetyltransferase